MRILLVLTSTEVGTIQKLSHELYKTLAGNHQLELFVVNLNSSKDDYYEFEKLYILGYRKYRSFIARQCFNLLKVYKLYRVKKIVKPDVSISTQEAGTSINLLSGGTEKKIGFFHSPLFQSRMEGAFQFYIQYFSYRFLYNKLDALFCVSVEVRNSILQTFVIEQYKCKIVYNIHDFHDIFLKSMEMIDEFDKSLFDGKTILYVGRMDVNKAPDRLIKSFSIIRKKNIIDDDVKLVFVGKGEDSYVRILYDLVSDLGLDGYVYFLGYKSNPYKYIRNATVLVSSSFSEGLPGVLIESLFIGTPIVSTNSSIGVWEILSVVDSYNSALNNFFVASKGIITSNHRNGTFDEVNILSLSSALELILTDIVIYKKMKESNFLFKEKLNNIDLVEYIRQV